MNIAENMLDLIGKTPLVKINKLNQTKATILAKIESRNPARRDYTQRCYYN